MMLYGAKHPKSFQGDGFAKITSPASISKVKLSLRELPEASSR